MAEEEQERIRARILDEPAWRGTARDLAPLPGVCQQAKAAYKALADAGGGTMRSLTKDPHINYQVLILAFGEQWRNQVAAYSEEIETGDSNITADTRR